MGKKSKRTKKVVKLILKLAFSAFAVYFILNNADINKTITYIRHADPFYLIIAFFLFNISKIVSAFRLNEYFKSIKLQISSFLNLKLYYIGMFYNLFLPGGVGGDGYKVFLLNKHHQTSVKQLIFAQLLDRGSGLAALLFIAMSLFLLSTAHEQLQNYNFIIYLALILIYPAFFILVHVLFRIFQKKFILTNLLSFGVQGTQVIAVYFILLSLGLTNGYINYFVLFLVSSAASIIPISFGGFGLRELVFIYGYKYLCVDKDFGVALSLLFYAITAVSSFSGVFFNYKKLDNE